MTTQDTRKILNEFVGQEGVDLGVLSTTQQARVLEIQARFVAMNEAGHVLSTGKGWEKDPKNAVVLNDAEWEKSGINADNARAEVESGKGVGKLAPASGDIAASALLGYIKPETKNNLLILQAGERTLQAAENIMKPAGNDHAMSAADFLKNVDAAKWQHLGDAHDSKELQGAQAANYMAEMLNNTVKLDPQLAQNPKVAHAVLAAETLALDAEHKGAAEFAKTNPEVTGKVMAMTKDIAKEKHRPEHPSQGQNSSAIESLNEALNEAKRELVTNGKVSAQELETLNKKQEAAVGMMQAAHPYHHAEITKGAQQLMEHPVQAPATTPRVAPPAQDQAQKR